MCDQPMRGHASQDTNCDGHKSSQAVSCRDRQISQSVSCCDQQTSQGVSCCDRHTSQGYNFYKDYRLPQDYKLPPGVDSESLPQWAISRGDFKMHPNDKYTVRQQALLDMDEEVGSEDDWKYKKDSDESHNEYSFASVDDMHTTNDDGPPPPPPPPLPPMPGPGPAVGAGTTVSGSRCVEPLNEFKNTHGSTVSAVAAPRSRVSCCDTAHTSSAMMAAQYDGRTAIAQAGDVSSRGIHDQFRNMDRPEESWSRMAVLMDSYRQGSTDNVSEHENNRASQRPLRKGACAIVNSHLASRPLPRVVPRGEATPPPQQSREEVQQHPQVQVIAGDFNMALLRGSDQQPPPQPRGEGPFLRPSQPPPPLPPPAYTLEYFMNHVQIFQHWSQHDNALRHFRQLGRNMGNNSFLLNERIALAVPTKPDKRKNHSIENWSGECTTWCWHELLTQLDNASLRMVVEGSMNASGIALCKIHEGSQRDSSRPSTADKKTSNGRDKEVLYRWEFALLRDNGTVAFLVPDGVSTKVEYYEGLPTDGVSAVATLQFRHVSDARTETRPECNTRDARDHPASSPFHAEVPFPNKSSLTLTPVQTLKFMEHRGTNHNTRGSALRPPQHHNMQPRR
jgi:hypothetical protein